MKLIVFNDVHELSTHEIKVDWVFGDNAYCIGDVVDLVNCRKDHVEAGISKLKYLKQMFGAHKFVLGNHECSAIDSPLFTTKNGVMLTHGDQIAYSAKKFKKRRNKTPGSGFIKRWLAVPFMQIGRVLFKRNKLNDKLMSKAAKYAKSNRCHTIIMGHFHPKHKIDQRHDGIRVVVLPRGRNEVEL